MEEITFVVSYAPDWVQIEAAYAEKSMACPKYSLNSQYKEGLERKKKKYGELVGFNNRFWCTVKATTPLEALKKMLDKMNAYHDSNK